MYLDESIRVDFKMPPSLREVIEETDAAVKAGDEFHFLLGRDDVEVVAKSCAINGSITQSQMDAIFRRYGLR